MVNPEHLCFVAIMPLLYHIVSIFISIPKQSKSESNNKAHVQQEKKMIMEEKAGKPKRPDDSLPLIESLITKNNTTKPSLKNK